MIELSVDPPVVPAAGPVVVTVRLHNDSLLACTNLFVAFDVPAGLGLERGRRPVELERLGPGETHEHPLRLHPPEPGVFAIGISNLSFRDGFGSSCRYRGRALEVTVGAPVVRPVREAQAAGAGRSKGSRRKGAPTVFLSYRRADTDDIAGLLVPGLVAKLPGVRVFYDRRSLWAGQEWPARLERELGECAVLIALIGPAWLGPRVGAQPRIEDLDDPVRGEVGTALRRGIPVLPVLFGTVMPEKEQLPSDIRGLARIKAVELDRTRYSECVLATALAVRALIDGGPPPEPLGAD